MLFLDGAYTFRGQRPTFHRAHQPAGEELNDLLDTLSRRIVRVLERRGLLIADPEHPSLDWVPDSSLDHLQAASVAYRIAIGPHAGRKALTLYSVPPLDEAANSPLLAKVAGFSLHAATVCEAHQRGRLERLCRYITRPPIATKRLSTDGQCGGSLRVMACIEDPPLSRKLLAHVQRREALTRRFPRAPPDSQPTLNLT